MDGGALGFLDVTVSRCGLGFFPICCAGWIPVGMKPDPQGQNCVIVRCEFKVALRKFAIERFDHSAHYDYAGKSAERGGHC